MSVFRTDPSTSSILEAMRSGAMSMKQAADALGMETAMLAYHLAAKVWKCLHEKQNIQLEDDNLHLKIVRSI